MTRAMDFPTPYVRKPFYYETDRMGVVHHSNYIRWLEEARIDFITKLGAPYSRLDAVGVEIPVISAECEYKLPVRYGDEVGIKTALSFFNGVRMTFSYEIYFTDSGKLSARGQTSHCFVDAATMRPLNLKKRCLEYYETVMRAYEAE
ncbi:MAG: acyl-CoA thioesterase [Oscillospiraceae bacterium]|nr:acyl-CoA thioesterase [Oscillospiraceae bacterium]MCD8099807.1 acyl-CoA thioesterase [Oscillospiraceae bacterium]